MSYFEDVLRWHRDLEMPIGDHVVKPGELDSDSMKMGLKLVKEEYDEIIKHWEDGNIAGVADNAGDLIWVLCGAMVRAGIDLDNIWEGIKAANYAKVGGPRREDGKLLKPPGWKPPDTLADIQNGRRLKDIP